MFFHRAVPEQEWSVVPGKQISLSFHPEELARGEGQKKIWKKAFYEAGSK